MEGGNFLFVTSTKFSSLKKETAARYYVVLGWYHQGSFRAKSSWPRFRSAEFSLGESTNIRAIESTKNQEGETK
jgi:hypothetical protein